MLICSSYVVGGDDEELFACGNKSLFLSMRVILLAPLLCSVRVRRYRAVDRPAMPPPRIMMCSHSSMSFFVLLGEDDAVL